MPEWLWKLKSLINATPKEGYIRVMKTPYTGMSLPNPKGEKFVNDVNQAVKWASLRGNAPTIYPNLIDFTETFQHLPSAGGGESDVFFNIPGFPNQVLKRLNTPAEYFRVNGFSAPEWGARSLDELISLSKQDLDIRNKYPFAMKNSLVGYTLGRPFSQNGGLYHPVYSQGLVRDLNGKDWIKYDTFLNKIGLGNPSYMNNIIKENFYDFPNTYNWSKRDPNHPNIFDVKESNLGVTSDGTVMGIDIKRSGGILKRIK